ncbi:hypothetical protein ACQP1V_42740 (plasmid) [Microtetraspora malaysiensis]|uniref:hypothetical protein n=1 Tax=Microtetraspora malaysiensis TaxID=161358 RepID=UPI003D936292
MRPRLLDAFCGVDGAARGYQEAGFEVVDPPAYTRWLGMAVLAQLPSLPST